MGLAYPHHEDDARSLLSTRGKYWSEVSRKIAQDQAQGHDVNEDGKPKIYGVVTDIHEVSAIQEELQRRYLARRVAALAPLFIGLALVAEGEDRFHIPGFAVANQLAPGWGWGTAFLVCGVLMNLYAWQAIKWVFWPSFVVAVMFLVWTVMLVVAAVTRGAPWTGPAIYGWATVVMCAVAASDVTWIVRWVKKTAQRVQRFKQKFRRSGKS